MCDGLGACIGHCPQGAITIEKREAEPYDEKKVMEAMVPKGKNTVAAHIRHLSEHNEKGYLKEAREYLYAHEQEIPFAIAGLVTEEVKKPFTSFHAVMHNSGGCPGSRTVSFGGSEEKEEGREFSYGRSELRQWPVQMHLVNVNAPYFRNADLLLAADCTAFAMGDFHRHLKGKVLVIACPKLDTGKEIYIEKMTALIETAMINTVTVMIMEVPCCRGLLQIVMAAKAAAKRNVPVKVIVTGIEGNVVSENWV
jgi:ferredoxin